MRNIALFLTYLGTHYHGWQVQKNLPTVAETMEKAAAMVVGHPVHMTGCGRTDAGVHARVYVANFRTSSTIPVERLPYALNTHLPCDIVVTKAFEVHENFNAIGSCPERIHLPDLQFRQIRFMSTCMVYPRHLDENVIKAAANQFVGTHDYRAVKASVQCQIHRPHCTITMCWSGRGNLSPSGSAPTVFAPWRGPWRGQ